MGRSWTEETLRPFMQAPRGNVGVYCVAQFRFPRAKNECVRADDSCGPRGAEDGTGCIWTGNVGRHVVENGTWL